MTTKNLGKDEIVFDQQRNAPFFPLNLQFFDEGEKTEQATSKKREKARGEGQVAKSQEVSTAFLLLAAFYGLNAFGKTMFTKMLSVYTYSLGMVGNVDKVFAVDFSANYVSFMFTQTLLICAPILVLAMIVGVVSNVVQVGFHITTKPLMPKFSKLNPITGFKRLFSMRAIVDLVKSVAKISIILYVIYSVVEDEIQKIPDVMGMEVLESLIFFSKLTVKLGFDVGYLFIFIALSDYIYTRFKHGKDLRMTKHEVKEEYKQAEGNPQIKGKIRQKMREISMRRMMQSVPQADVIITNPTHYAVALTYDKSKGDAPIVSAKGVDFLAKRIREKAKESDVEIVENVELARAIYNTVKIGQEIPPDLYQAVAEVLAFVYKLKNRA